MKRFLRITQEGAFGTFPGSPTSIHLRLDSANAFKVMTQPEFYRIMSGTGFAVGALFGSETTALGATLSGPLHYSQASFLLGWALQRINAGQTSPWVTTEKPGDLPSCTCDFAWSNFDETLRRKRFLGCKVASFSLSGSRSSPVMRFSMQVIGSTPQGNSYDASSDPDGTAFPEPALTDFPTDPILFQHARGGLTVNNVAHSNFQSLNFNVSNACKAYWDESRFANAIRMNGRTTTLSGSSRLKATPDDRASYEQAATLASANTLAFTNGVNTLTFTLNAQNYFSSIDEDMPLDEEVYYNWTLSNMLDPSAGSDFSFTYA
jgi:hypothetical protein